MLSIPLLLLTLSMNINPHFSETFSTLNTIKHDRVLSVDQSTKTGSKPVVNGFSKYQQSSYHTTNTSYRHRHQIDQARRKKRYIKRAGQSWIRPGFIEQHNTYYGTLKVPLGYKNHRRQKVELAYAIKLAKENPESKATLWINYGGPGSNAVDAFFSKLHLDHYPEALLKNYNIILVDPRGTGYSGFSHVSKNDQFFLNLAPFIGTNTLAQDIESLRRHLETFSIPTQEGSITLQQVNEINLLGHSYGTTAFMNYAHFYPDHVRALILDSVDDILSYDSLKHLDDKNRATRHQRSWKRKLTRLDDSVQNVNLSTLNLVHCIDKGYVGQVFQSMYNFNNYRICSYIKRDYITHLKYSSALKNLNYPVLLVSSTYDIQTPHVWAKAVQQRFFPYNSLMLTIQSDQHSLSFSKSWTTEIDQQVMNYLEDPEHLNVAQKEITYKKEVLEYLKSK